MELWTAYYCPSDTQGGESKFDLPDENAAIEYVCQNMCTDCQAERARAAAGSDDDNLHPSCYHEWLVMPTAKYQDANGNWDKLCEAGGWNKIWEKS